MPRKWSFRTFVHVMRLYAVLYAGMGIVLVAAPKLVFQILNIITEVLHGKAIDVNNEPFWGFVSASLTFTLAFICLWAAYDARYSKVLVIPMIFSKFASGAILEVYFLAYGVTPYLLGGMVDLTLGAFALLCWKMTQFQETPNNVMA